MTLLTLALLAGAHDGAQVDVGALDSHALPPLPCATPDLWRPVDPVVDPPPVLGVDLQLRDAYSVPNVATSEHFAVRWGNERFVDPADVEELLEFFETAWDVELGQMGHTPPYRTDEFYFNVYVGDTGSGAPPGHGAGGYYTADVDGWPMIVIPADSMERPEGAASTVAHEFYHAVQAAEQRYTYSQSEPGAWYWEATATWAAQVVYPDDQSHARFLFGYALFPHYRLDFFDYPDQGVVQEYYQYGAFLFPLHVQQRTGSWQVVRDSWVRDLGTDDPVEALRVLLAEQDVDFDELWLDHIARNATWDYPNKRAYTQILEQAGFLAEARFLVAGDIRNRGTLDWEEPDAEALPQRYGANTWTMSLPRDGEYTFVIEADELGSEGNPARLGATLVLEPFEGEPEYRRFEVEGQTASLFADDIDDYQRAYVVVGTWTPESVSPFSRETFGYRLRVDYDDLEPDPADEAPEDQEAGVGCGCASGAAGAPWLGLALLGVLGLRRRR